MKKKIMAGFLVLLILLQAFQPSKNNGNSGGPKDISKTIAVPENILVLLKRSCYDCHSNHTNYPWYDHITPVNWWVADHIKEGKRELNFTVFGEYNKRRQLGLLEGIGETVQFGEMPLKSYLLMHGEARLSKGQKQAIYDWTRTAMTRLSSELTSLQNSQQR